MSIKSIKDLYVHELQDIYSAETQILKALPKMAEKASDTQLTKAFNDHLRVTQEQVSRLQHIFGDLGKDPEGKKCKGMAGLIAEGDDMMKEEIEPEVLDAALIAAAQRVEHYEIAAYGTARTYATQLGLDHHAELLQRTLDEEGQTDKDLTRLAEGRVNPDAGNGGR